MQITGHTLPGYRVHEYMLVLNPHEELRNRIIQLRKEWTEHYELEPLTGKPGIALASFTQYEMMEERLLNRLKVVGMGFPPFKIELGGFGSFPSHSIFISVASRSAVQSLVKELRSSAQRLMKLNDENKPHFLTDPHIILARKLKPWQYEKIWEEHREKKFTACFIADSMTLLRKPGGEGSFKTLARFGFQNLPVATKQGALFG